MQYRNTRQRKIVLEAVQEHHDHPSADQIYLRSVQRPENQPRNGLSELNILSEEGQITHVKVPGADRYDCRTDFHYHHLICTGCGRSPVMPAAFIRPNAGQNGSQRKSGIDHAAQMMSRRAPGPACQEG